MWHCQIKVLDVNWDEWMQNSMDIPYNRKCFFDDLRQSFVWFFIYKILDWIAQWQYFEIWYVYYFNHFYRFNKLFIYTEWPNHSFQNSLIKFWIKIVFVQFFEEDYCCLYFISFNEFWVSWNKICFSKKTKSFIKFYFIVQLM